jgi:hypothetical protein
MAMTCAKCGRAVPEGSKFCLNCGTPLNIASRSNTVAAETALDTGETVLDTGETVLEATPTPNQAAPPLQTPTPRTPAPSGTPSADSARRGDTSRSPTLSSSTWSRSSRFAPGTMLAGRYRIVAKLGRGGMGEVYRAEDLTLDQEVALKFLPTELASDPSALARFHGEVRLARQVSHPNVCRVFDIGMADGAPFITMEYVDGEDLASLIRRVGRFPQDKGLEIARQICAGLAAAHEQGLLHRDLKPANIMLDGRGRIRIADFGLASVAGEAQGADARSGTPAYMAPEQLAGGEPTVKSDVYSLGLVLYEIFTGKRAYDAATIPELQKQRNAAAPATPTALVKELDPIVERVILRCIEKDPSRRPGSALQVAAALPGGDPLAAALAAGETPSPEMVARAGSTEASSPTYVWTCIGIIVMAIALEFALSGRARLIDTAGVPDSPDVMTARAQEILRGFGYVDKPGETANGFDTDTNYLTWIDNNDHSDTKWNRAAGTIDFWYRQAPAEFNQRQILGAQTQGRVSATDPPMEDPGMIRIDLDPAGRMNFLEVVTRRKPTPESQSKTFDWNQLLRAAGFDPVQCKPAALQRNPYNYADAVAAWDAPMPERPEVTLHLDAAAYAGKPVYFTESGPWTPAPGTGGQIDRSQEVAVVFAILILGGMLILGSVRAWQNVKQERADLQGAFRLAAVMFSIEMGTWILGASHAAKLWEGYSLTLALAWASLASLFLWMIYIALEPFLRRRMPTTLIAWTRLISGEFRDPLIGRGVLAGVAVASLSRILGRGDVFYAALKHLPPPMPSAANPLLPTTAPYAFAEVLSMIASAIFNGFALVCVFVLLRRVLGNQWLTAVAFVGIWAVRGFLQGGVSPLDMVLNIASLALLAWLLIRFGLLAVIIETLVENLFLSPITVQGSAWYAWMGWLGVGVIAALVIYSSRTALAGKPFLGKVAFAEQ